MNEKDSRIKMIEGKGGGAGGHFAFMGGGNKSFETKRTLAIPYRVTSVKKNAEVAERNKKA